MKNGIGTAIVVICLLLQASLLHAFRFTTSGPDREDALEKAVLYLTGASDMESLSEEEADRWWRLSESPLPLNLAGRGRLEASGLLSAYQIASLLDYRSHSGDILSIAELSAVDGFGRETAEALSMFVTLESAALPGRSSDYRPSPRGSMSAGGGDKFQLDSDGKMMENTYSWYGRFRSYADGRYDAGVAFKRYYADAGPLPSSYSGYAAAYGRRHLEKVVLGDFALRFGQGLALWTGFSVSGFSGPMSFWKRPSGISPSGSWSSSSNVRGIAVSVSCGSHAGISVFTAFPGFRNWCESGGPLSFNVMPGVNAAWYSRHGQVSVTYFAEIGSRIDKKRGSPLIMLGDRWNIPLSKVSADARFCIRGVEMYGEAALDVCSLKPAVAGGIMTGIADNWKAALSGRFVPDGYDLELCSPVRAYSGKKGETGAAAGLFFGDAGLTVDWSVQPGQGRRQANAAFTWPVRLSGTLALALKVRERWRSYGVENRTDVRADLKWSPGRWLTALRGMTAVYGKVSWLGYVEQGYEGRIGAVFLRGTLFHADSWDGRLYCYERDAPGGFNVPAYYGRGYAVSVYARLKTASWHDRRRSSFKAYFRAGYSAVPWKSPGLESPRPSRLELKAQVVYDF